MEPLDRRVTVFAAIGHVTLLSYELVLPLFVVHWPTCLDTTPAVLGIVVGIGYALTGIGAIPGGILADQYNTKGLVLGSLLGMAGGFAIVGMTPNLLVPAFGLIVWGTAASLSHPTGLALISRATTERGTALAYHGVAGNVGVGTGPILGAILLTVSGWRTVAGLLVGLGVLGSALALILLRS
jgi:MFS family permease